MRNRCGHTSGIVAAVDATVVVEWEKRCGSTKQPQRVKFVNQIIITPSDFASFGQGGDSGSLVVEDVESCPRPVGLLFAGTESTIAANPIGAVLTALGARLGTTLSIVGCADGGELASAQASASATSLGGVTSDSHASACVAKEQTEASLLNIPGVVGCGVGRCASDPSKAVVKVLVEKDSPELRKALPATVQGVPCEVVETGVFRVF